MRGKRLAVVVSTSGDTGDLDRAFELATAARAARVDVDMFFMHEAVRGLPQRIATVAALTDDGCELVACATSAETHDLTETQVGMMLGSQDDHAAMVRRAHRVVAFT